jgi:hypothetical protein
MRLWNRAIAFTIVALILLFALGVAYGNHMAEKLGARSRIGGREWCPLLK